MTEEKGSGGLGSNPKVTQVEKKSGPGSPGRQVSTLRTSYPVIMQDTCVWEGFSGLCSLLSCVLAEPLVLGCGTMQQAGWLKTRETASLAVLRGRSPKSRCWQGCDLPEDSKEILFHASSWLGDVASKSLVLLGP